MYARSPESVSDWCSVDTAAEDLNTRERPSSPIQPSRRDSASQSRRRHRSSSPPTGLIPSEPVGCFQTQPLQKHPHQTHPHLPPRFQFGQGIAQRQAPAAANRVPPTTANPVLAPGLTATQNRDRPQPIPEDQRPSESSPHRSPGPVPMSDCYGQ